MVDSLPGLTPIGRSGFIRWREESLVRSRALPLETTPLRGMLMAAHSMWPGWEKCLSKFTGSIATGRKELWKEIMPADLVGVKYLPRVALTPDGKSYAYSYYRHLSDLYLVEGLK